LYRLPTATTVGFAVSAVTVNVATALVTLLKLLATTTWNVALLSTDRT
jgi:hypothetical protein